MSFFKSLVLAFSMFSAIPMPRVEWNERSIRYMMCSFPFVGAVIGFLYAAAYLLVERHSELFSFCTYIFPLVLVVLPIAVTGGIHFDGFMDTVDALSSHAEREKKLAIMKDSHCGSFAVLSCALYLLANYALELQAATCIFVTGDSIPRFQIVLCFSARFMLSRLLSALAVATFPLAKNSGLVRTFSDASAKRFTVIWCSVLLLALSCAIVLVSAPCGLCVVGAELLVFAWYYVMAKRNFGGITGDTAGAFVQIAELASLAAAFFAVVAANA